MIKSTVKKIIGVILLLFGIVALIMPVLPGAWLIFVGMELLGLGFLIPEWIRRHGRQAKEWILCKAGYTPVSYMHENRQRADGLPVDGNVGRSSVRRAHK